MPKISELDATTTAALKAKAGTTTLPADLAAKAVAAANYLVVGGAEAALPNERRLVAGANITLTDGGAGGELVISAAGGGGGGASAAADVSLVDAGGFYLGTSVEAALQEVGTDITSLESAVGSKAPLASNYLVVGGADALLPNERRIVAGANITITDGGAGSTLTIAGVGGGGDATYAALAAASGSSLIGFNRSEAGSVARTVQTVLRDMINVKDFGAVGDGATDCRAAIIAADAAAFAASKTLFFPGGVYRISAPISGLKAAWQGEHPGSKVIAAPGMVLNGPSMLEWGSINNTFLRDMMFDGNGLTVTVGSEGLVGMTNCGGFDVTACRFLNLVGSGLALNGAQRFAVRQCHFTKTAASTAFNEAILVSSSSRMSRNGFIEDNYLSNSGMNLSCVDCHVVHNYITGFGFGAGITTEQDSTNSIRYRILNNIIENSSTAIDVNGYRPGGIENWGAYSIIAGNFIADCAGAGIDQGGVHTIVRDNTIINNGRSGSDNTPGPQTAGGDGISIRYGNATFNGSYSVVCNNYIADTRAAGDKVQGYGLSMQSASIVGVHVYGNRYDGNWLGDESLLGTNGWFMRPLSNGNFKVQTSGGGSWEFTCPVIYSGALSVGGSLTVTGDVNLPSGNRVRLQGAGNLTGVRYSSPNVEIFVGPSLAAGFGTNTVGFCGTSPISKPTITGSRGGNAALASLLSALESMGLITNSTTA